jgi:hypothetical protein
MAAPAALLGLLGRYVAPMVPGIVKRNPWKSAAGAGATGLLGYEMMGGGEKSDEVRTGGVGSTVGQQVRGRTTIPDDWQPTLGSRVELEMKRKASNAKHLKTILVHNAILSAHNPGSKNTYMKDALDLLKADAIQNNDIQQAKIIESIKNKDGSLPDDAKIIYDRIIRSGGDPKFAAEVSGHQLKIEKTQAEAAGDYQRGLPQMKDMYSKEAIAMQQLKAQYDSGDQQNAVNKLAMFIKSSVIKIPDIYAGFEIKNDADLHTLAAQMLQGLGGTQVATEDEIVINEQ